MHNQWGEIRLDQHDHAHANESLQCPSSARDDQALTLWEVSGLRGLSGSLQWLATQTLPSIQAQLSILQGDQQTVGTMRKLNKLRRQAQQSCSRTLIFHCHRAPCVVTYSDAAWDVRRKGESQSGYLMCLADVELLSYFLLLPLFGCLPLFRFCRFLVFCVFAHFESYLFSL